MGNNYVIMAINPVTGCTLILHGNYLYCKTIWISLGKYCLNITMPIIIYNCICYW